MTHTISVQFIYSGMLDFWGGDGDRWDDNKGCLFASYNHETTMQELVSSFLDDFELGGDCESFPPEVDREDIREAILASFTDQGRADYEADRLCEWAERYANDIGDSGDDMDDMDRELPQVVVLVTVDTD